VTVVAGGSVTGTSAGRSPKSGIGLCLSGGGYRAMLFHVGALWRLNEAGYLSRLDRISSVSGGSITAGRLALAWTALDFGPDGVARRFEDELVAPIRRAAGVTIDWKAAIAGLLLPGRTAGGELARWYAKLLFGEATLQDLPDAPRFVFNAANLQTGSLFRFSKPYMADYRIGMIEKPTVALATAVAASSAFPPVLSPLRLALDPSHFTPDRALDLQREPFTRSAILTDGGVYDNFGIETVWKRLRTVLVSDGGQKMGPVERPGGNWLSQIYRVLQLTDNQVRSLRKREMINEFSASAEADASMGGDVVECRGTYWGMTTNIADYGLSDTLPCPLGLTSELAQIRTALSALESQVQERIIDWGYAVCDAAMRRYIAPWLAAPIGFPYPSVWPSPPR